MSSNVNIFCLEHFYTIRYDTFLHTFLCSTKYQKLVFYAGIPLNKAKKSCIKPKESLCYESSPMPIIHDNSNDRILTIYY